MEMPVITLSNGIRVGNFSSPHQFYFADGSILPACSPERARFGALEAIEELIPHERLSGRKWTDIRISFKMSDSVRTLLWAAHEEAVDIILVPLPVLQAVKEMRETAGPEYDYFPKVRCIRVADRVTKTIHIDRFCI